MRSSVMSRFRNSLLACLAVLSLGLAAARGAVTITNTQVTNIGTTTFTVIWETSEVSTPGLEVFSDAAGTTSVTTSLGLEYYPIAEGDPSIVNNIGARGSRRALELLAINRRVVSVRVTGLSPGTMYYVRPRSFGLDGLDNSAGVVALKSATTAQFNSMVVDGRIVRVRFPAFSAEGMLAVIQGPAGTTPLSAIVGDSTSADSALFPLINLIDTATGTNALLNTPRDFTIRVFGLGAPSGSFVHTFNFGSTFNPSKSEFVEASLTSPSPTFTTHPASKSEVAGTNVTFTAAATGSPAPTIQWQRKPVGAADWTDLVDNASYTGTSTGTLTVLNAVVAISGDQFRAVASNGNLPNAISDAATLTVTLTSIAPAFTTQPFAANILVGENAYFTVAASGSPTATYQWQRKIVGTVTWTNLTESAVYTGTTTASLVVHTSSLGMSGDQFRAIASNGVAPDATSTAVLLTVNAGPVAPSFTTHPLPFAALLGENATFTVAATGSPAPTYRWQRKIVSTDTWVDLTENATYTGTTNSSLVVHTTTLAMSGDQFRAVASNNVLPTATSNAATLTVSATPTAPSITTQPLPVAAIVGENATFIVAASGSPAATYQWQRKVVLTDTWMDLTESATYTGTTAGSLVVHAVTLAMSGDQFRAVASNGVAPNATSSAVALTVNTGPTAPSINPHPQSIAVTAGLNAAFTVGATGTPVPTFKWQRKAASTEAWVDLVAGGTYSGVTSTTLTVANTTTTMSGDAFRAIATNGVVPDATSNAAILTVNGAGVAPQFTTHPAFAVVVVGANPTFTVAASGTPVPTYTWQRKPAGIPTWSDVSNGGAYSGATTATLTLTNVTIGMSGDEFRAIATNGVAPNATSNSASLTVNPATNPVATVALSKLQQTYNGQPRAVTVATTPTGLTVNVTYNGSATVPTYPGSYTVVAQVNDAAYTGTATDTLVILATAFVQHVPSILGGVDGSIQVASAENMTLAGWISGDLMMPGTPGLTVNPTATLVGPLEGPGSASPTTHTLTMNAGSALRYLVRRIDSPVFPTVLAPPLPTGTRSVNKTTAAQSIGDFATLRTLSVSGSAGQVVVPPGTYGNLSVNGSAALVFGEVGGTVPAVYNLQNLLVNQQLGTARVVIVGPVIITVATGASISGVTGSPDHPEWLTLRASGGNVVVAGNGALHGSVVAPKSTVTLSGRAIVKGSVIADRLNIAVTAELEQLPQP